MATVSIDANPREVEAAGPADTAHPGEPPGHPTGPPARTRRPPHAAVPTEHPRVGGENWDENTAAVGRAVLPADAGVLQQSLELQGFR